MEAAAKALFQKCYNYTGDFSDAVGVRAPGRVNLIGEHTDYQEGLVMPIAIDFETAVVAKLTTTGTVRVASVQQDGVVFSFPGDDASIHPGENKWFKYIQGVIKEYLSAELKPRGMVSFDAAFASSVPLGGGLSSSASLEVATATLLEALYSIEGVEPAAKALRCVNAEHVYAGVPCGIMDQFASTMATKDHALMLDCRLKVPRHIPLKDPSLSFVICNSNAPHKLSGSEYPDRVRQCSEAVAIIRQKQQAAAQQNGANGGSETGDAIQAKVEINFLRDVSLEMLERWKSDMDEVNYKRAKHVISENVRVVEAVAALEKEDYKRFGELMYQSHLSLKNDFQVSTPELDKLVEIAKQVKGVWGSRMTGGGFGGCTVTLVESDQAEALIRQFEEKYNTTENNVKCTCWVTRANCGTGRLF